MSHVEETAVCHCDQVPKGLRFGSGQQLVSGADVCMSKAGKSELHGGTGQPRRLLAHDGLGQLLQSASSGAGRFRVMLGLYHLVYNAVKHNPQGCDIGIVIKHNADALTVSISDTGLGIDPLHIPRLTERFYRADSSRATQSGGTGLGLAIVKHVLLRHNGELKIESTLGKGATFTCRFAQD